MAEKIIVEQFRPRYIWQHQTLILRDQELTGSRSYMSLQDQAVGQEL